MLLEELKIKEPERIKLFVDNKSAIGLANHPMCHGRSKYINDVLFSPGSSKLRETLTWALQDKMTTKWYTHQTSKIVRFDDLKRNITMRSLKNIN